MNRRNGLLADGIPFETAARAVRESEGGRILKRTASKAVLLVPGDPFLVVSRYERGVASRFGLGVDRARRAFRAAQAIRRLGVPAAHPLFALRQGRRSWLGTSFVGPGRDLDAALRARADLGASLRELAESIARAHAAGWRLRDLRAENLLVDAEGRVRLVDFDGVSPSRAPARHARDLARLSASFPPGGPVSNGLRLRFLVRYLRARRALGRPVRRPRSFARRAAARTQALWNLWRRRGFDVGPQGVRLRPSVP